MISKWKLCRQSYGTEEFALTEGEEVTIGRSLTNNITLSSFVISRNHCVLTVQKNKVMITDLMVRELLRYEARKVHAAPCILHLLHLAELFVIFLIM